MHLVSVLLFISRINSTIYTSQISPFFGQKTFILHHNRQILSNLYCAMEGEITPMLMPVTHHDFLLILLHDIVNFHEKSNFIHKMVKIILLDGGKFILLCCE